MQKVQNRTMSGGTQTGHRHTAGILLTAIESNYHIKLLKSIKQKIDYL